MSRFPRIIAALLSATVFVVGCATDPAELGTPQRITCVELQAPLSFSGDYGMIPVKWTTRLEKGAYVSEKVDDKGTYFRAPPGGLSISGKGGKPFPGWPLTMDGGFYVPFSASEPVWIYRYFSMAAAPVDASSATSSCASVAYLRDPSSSKLSIVKLATAGAVGGAVGGILGRSIAKGSALSYGRAAGVGAASGVIAGTLIGAVLNAGVGKIVPTLPIKDAAFMEKLRGLAAKSVAVPEFQQRVTADGARAGAARP